MTFIEILDSIDELAGDRADDEPIRHLSRQTEAARNEMKLLIEMHERQGQTISSLICDKRALNAKLLQILNIASE